MGLSETLAKLRKIEEIPTLPSVAAKVLEVANSENSTATDLNRVISQDAALTTKTLKLVNSAYYGFPRTVTKITEAIVILGFNAVKNLALSVSVCEFFNKADDNFDRRKLWLHSVGVAVTTGLIAKKLNIPGDNEEAFIAGLLHDIGIIIEDQFLHDEFIESLKVAKEKDIPIEHAEKEVLGMDHASIGKKILQSWKLPGNLSKIIGFHHEPQYAYADTKRDTAIIYIADLICKLKKIGFDGDTVIPKLRVEAFKALGLKKEDIKEIAKDVDEELKKAEDFINLIEN
ncbi:MAG: HD family phosphohydrolase [Candidatus Muiribacterium halophilum]|uniref:HD family phosphohydrolase n=1 Tax=Muiribacterium halophilum TaxID=2053465 RepID=A0A2N5ZAX6_MUIH1|nr:MAG: HD family phosphohydrolase [Candidatus Muirbacterium halophilum]